MPRPARFAAAIALFARAALAQSDLVVEKNVMIPSRDGVREATDIYRPTNAGRLPVLLHRTPYGKRSEEQHLVTIAEYFARHGYVVAVQDIRGRFASEGDYRKLQPVEADDGFDTIEWLAKQPWSNGTVGMWGTSYAAHTQAGAAQRHPPALRTVVLNMGGMPNAWDHGVRYRGAYELGRQLTWAWKELHDETKDPVVRKTLETEKVEDWYSAQPFRRGQNPLSGDPRYEAYYVDWYEHGDFGSLWRDNPMLDWEARYGVTSDIPMTHVGGWFDIFLAGTFENFVELRKIKTAPQRIVVGPWTHHGNVRPYAGDVSFGADAAIADFDSTWHLRWFDRWLKNRTDLPNDPPVRLFVMGTGDGHKDAEGRLFHGGYWRDATTWPLPGTRFVPYYLHGDGTLSTARPNGSATHTTYAFDPRDPVPTIGGGVSARLKDGAYDQREGPRFPPSTPPYLPLKARADVLVFETPPLAEDVTIVGPITVTLYASTDAKDTDFTAKLVDVYPPSADFPSGFDMNLTDAIVRGRYRATTDHEVLLTPGRVYPFTIAPFPTANVFKKGHRIRLDISSSNFPRFDVNPNTGEPLGRERGTIVAHNAVWHSAQYPSHVVLPLAPAR